MAKKRNPKEEMVEEMSDEYVKLVYRLLDEFAPESPWWSQDLTPDQQLWRYMTSGRDEMVAWLNDAGALMGWEATNGAFLSEEALDKLDEIFTASEAVHLLHPAFVSKIPIQLLEMVQASGPHDFKMHIRKMERMLEGRMRAFEELGPLDATVEPAPAKDVAREAAADLY